RLLVEEAMRHGLELDRDLRDALRQALAGAQVERHSAPAPVVDRELEGRVGPRRGLGGDPWVLAIAPHPAPVHPRPARTGRAPPSRRSRLRRTAGSTPEP